VIRRGAQAAAAFAARLRLPARPAPAPTAVIPVATTPDLPGFRTLRHLGLVRGVSIRSRAAASNVFGGFPMMFGMRPSAYLRLAETARQEATDRMCSRAAELGANAVVGMRYGGSEIMVGMTEVLAYGSAVFVEPIE
jgi:uncharacterized protein YbjQ (UPF0145 family)